MQTIDYQLAAGVATVTLHRPDVRNAINPQMGDELGALFAAMRLDPEVRAVVLTGAGGAFCSGGDLREMGRSGLRSAEQRREAVARYRPLVTGILGLDRPVIAAVDGVAYGAGFSIALLADIILVSDRARMSMVFHRIGLVPDCGAWYTLPRIVGVQRAKELIYSAREIGAAEARDLGIALEVLPAAALLPRALELARSFAGASPIAMSLSKQALQGAPDLGAVLDLEASGLALAGASDYAQEAIRRFGAKEPPQFVWPAPVPGHGI